MSDCVESINCIILNSLINNAEFPLSDKIYILWLLLEEYFHFLGTLSHELLLKKRTLAKFYCMDKFAGTIICRIYIIIRIICTSTMFYMNISFLFLSVNTT